MSASAQANLQRDHQQPLPASVFKQPIADRATYDQLCHWADADPRSYWAAMARSLLDWHVPFSDEQILDDRQPPFYRWFVDGRINASYQCLDRHVLAGRGEQIALIFERDDGEVTTVSYADLLRRVSCLANALSADGVVAGDRVVIYMPMSIEAVVAMQACARIGATHSVVFAGFSAKSLADRIDDVGAKLLLTADAQVRGGKVLPIKTTVDEALAMLAHPIRRVVVYRRTAEAVPMEAGRDIDWTDFQRDCSDDCEAQPLPAEHPLFVLYTSGSTGKPKGVQHSTAGYLLWAEQTMRWTFALQPQDRFWCTADVGWITGHSYVAYGPLAAGATQLIFEGVPTYPDASRFWRMIAKHAVSVFYTAPTAIRALIKASAADDSLHPRHFDLSSLRALGSVGEPINPEAWRWYHEAVGQGRSPVLDTFWQTETGGHVITPLPGVTELVPGSCTLPLPGMKVCVVDETGQPVPPGQGGLLVIQRPWPSMIRTIWGNSDRFQAGYFPAELQSVGQTQYLAGDGALCDPKTGYFTITGRIDDVLNVSGHRLGTMEIESALVAHASVAEAAVVARPDDITGEAIVAFVTLKSAAPMLGSTDYRALVQELRDWVAQTISPIAKPKHIVFGDVLPKTRSGKIMRRLLRALARGETINQDISTLESPAALKPWQIAMETIAP